jgi:hypothetical protein
VELVLIGLIIVAIALASIVLGADSRLGLDHPQRRSI